MRGLLLVALLVAIGALGLTGCTGDEEPGAQAPEVGEQAPEGVGAGCEADVAPGPRAPRTVPEPDEELDPTRTHVAHVDTSCGAFEITLDVERAPETAASFVHLAAEDFYDGLTFHRIVPGFVIQGGDPQGDGTGGPGYSIQEPPPESLSYDRGVVAMAKTAAEPGGTSGSQFFVAVEDIELPPEYALVGEVTGGMEVVERIAASPHADERPRHPIVIRELSVRAG